MTKLRVFLILGVALLLVAGVTTAFAAPPKDSLVVVAGTSVPGGIVPHFEGAVPEAFFEPGQTIFVTWHLAYSKIGQNASNAGYPSNNSCPGTEIISATGVISDTDTGDVLATCTAFASGYLKFSK